MDPTIGLKPNRAAIIERVGPFLPFTQIRLHGRFSAPIIARCHIAHCLHVCLRSLHPSLNMRFSVPIQPWLSRRLASPSRFRFVGTIQRFGKITLWYYGIVNCSWRLCCRLAEVARHYLSRAHGEARGNKSAACKLVGLPNYQTFTNWMKKHGVEE